MSPFHVFQSGFENIWRILSYVNLSPVFFLFQFRYLVEICWLFQKLAVKQRNEMAEMGHFTTHINFLVKKNVLKRMYQKSLACEVVFLKFPYVTVERSSRLRVRFALLVIRKIEHIQKKILKWFVHIVLQ